MISLVLIVARLLCTFGATLFTRFISHFITVADANPGWKAPIILGWAGMRGVVSLGAALSIPVLIQAGQPFPYRNLILFITFVVILVTLVLQGLTLPWIIRKVNLEDRYTAIPEIKQEIIIQKKMAQHTLQHIEEKYDGDLQKNPHLANLHSKLKTDLGFFNRELGETYKKDSSLKDYQQVYLELLEHQRGVLDQMNHKAEFDEELIRKYLALIDIEEFKIREKMLEEDDPEQMS